MRKRGGEACARRAQAVGSEHRDERLHSDRYSDPTAPGRQPAAKTSPHKEVQVGPLVVERWVGGLVITSCLCVFVVQNGWAGGNSEFRIPNSEFFLQLFAADLFVDLQNLVAAELDSHQEIVVDRTLEVLGLRVGA